ncbi:Pp [Toxoplasma gondii ARI]|uniref:Pp n=1 Tax=Toxoplasma gondii ARI TaxID=1074872 RepID=A0A139YB39_TOXGO|nr:Pp [Toxoplasma gondii ARI]
MQFFFWRVRGTLWQVQERFAGASHCLRRRKLNSPCTCFPQVPCCFLSPHSLPCLSPALWQQRLEVDPRALHLRSFSRFVFRDKMTTSLTSRLSSTLSSPAFGSEAFLFNMKPVAPLLVCARTAASSTLLRNRYLPLRVSPVSSVSSLSSCASSVPLFSQPLALSARSAVRGGADKTRSFSTAQAQVQSDAGDAKATTVPTLFQYTVCPYCTATRAVFDFFALPYEVVEVHPFNKKEILNDPRLDKTYKKVPIALLDGEQVNDSREIIRRLCAMHKYTSPTAETGTGKMSPGEERDIDWAYTHFLPILPACLYSTLFSSWKAFDSIAALSNFSPLERLSVRVGGPLLMFAVSRMQKKKQGITDPAEAFENACSEWMQRVRNSGGAPGPFHGGRNPDIADVVVYGLFQALRNAEVLQAVRHKNPALNAWLLETGKAITRQ